METYHEGKDDDDDEKPSFRGFFPIFKKGLKAITKFAANGLALRSQTQIKEKCKNFLNPGCVFGDCGTI